MVGVFVFASAVGGYVLVLSNLILDRSPPRTAHDGISSLPRACAGPRCFAVCCPLLRFAPYFIACAPSLVVRSSYLPCFGSGSGSDSVRVLRSVPSLHPRYDPCMTTRP